MTRIGKIVSKDSELLVTDQHKEQDETDEGSDEQQKSKEQSLRCADAIDPTGASLCKSDSTSRQHHFQTVLEIFILRVFRVAPDVLPHHINDSGADQRVFNDERVQIRSRVLHDGSHDVDSLAARRIQMEWRDGR